MSVADLQRLIKQATPRIEDVRSPDRTDIIRREHGHLTLREVVDAIDALEFSAVKFVDGMKQVLSLAGEGAQPAPAATAVHGLFHAVDGVKMLTTALMEPSSATSDEYRLGEDNEALDTDATPEQVLAAGEARKRGAECFKQKDFSSAEAAYTEAIHATPKGNDELHTLYSNRSAARLQKANGDPKAALSDARRCVKLAPQWPKGHFREGSSLRQLGFLAEASRAFSTGQSLEPGNKDWEREVEKTEQLRCRKVPSLARQVLFAFLPEFLAAWSRGKDPTGVLQVQINGELKELGVPKWRLVREGKTHPKAQFRYAFLGRKDYLANLAANLQSPVDGVAVVDVEGKPLRIAEVGAFIPEDTPGYSTIHFDVKNDAGKMIAVICRVPCDDVVSKFKFLADWKEPEAPKGTVENVLKLQRGSGFPKSLPRYLGFQSFPGQLNYPVIDLERDAPGECGSK